MMLTGARGRGPPRWSSLVCTSWDCVHTRITLAPGEYRLSVKRRIDAHRDPGHTQDSSRSRPGPGFFPCWPTYVWIVRPRQRYGGHCWAEDTRWSPAGGGGLRAREGDYQNVAHVCLVLREFQDYPLISALSPWQYTTGMEMSVLAANVNGYVDKTNARWRTAYVVD